jgi:rSAM/selenodomain-associated transferase 1
MSETLVVVFARAPEPGQVKTRLVPRLGPAQASALHARLVRHTLATARDAALGAVELHCTPTAAHPFFLECAAAYGVALRAQQGDDLGARMAHACNEALRVVHAVLLIGTDCAVLDRRHLADARAALMAGHDAVFVPAEDGGYALVGLSRPLPGLFDGIDWGTSAVMAQTRERLSRLRARWKELAALWDVDRAEDYARLCKEGWLDRLPP